MDFWRAAHILARRKWLILLSVVVATTATWGLLHLIGGRWLATIRFVSPQLSPLSGAGNGTEGEAPLAEGRPEAEQAAKAQATLCEAMIQGRAVLEPALRQIGATVREADRGGGITFRAVGPRLFELQVTDSSRGRVTAFANALADSFIARYRDLHTQQAQRAVRVLEDQLREADAQLVRTRGRYDRYRAEHRIVGNATSSLTVALTRLREARQQRDGAAAQLAAAQSQLRAVETEIAAAPPTLPAQTAAEPGALARQLQDALARAEVQIIDLKSRFTETHSAVKQALAARQALQERLREETARQAAAAVPPPNPALATLRQQRAGLRREIVGCAAQIASLEGALAGAEGEIDRYKGADSSLGALAGEISEQAEARSSLVARLNRARMALDGAERQNPLAVLDRVSDFNPPVNSRQERALKLVLLAGLCALAGTCGLVLALECADPRLKSLAEATAALPVRVLAAIPQPLGDVTAASLPRVTELHPHSLHAESYRFLGLHLLSASGLGVRSLMVVAAKAEQGSTTTLTNLGITLAQAGRKVILVDANIRTAELHTMFALPNEYGLMDLLEDPDAEGLERALRPTSVPNLRVMTSGRRPENPWELFRSPHLMAVAQRLLERADYVLYDTPSAVLFTDALNLAPIIDAAYLSVRALEPLTGAERRLVELLQQADVTVLGGVLNDVPAAVVEGYPNYRHYYEPLAGRRPASPHALDAPGAAPEAPHRVQA
jgi:capsular exopolysaccharide synthesis family protein